MAEIASFGVNVDQNTKLAQNAQDTANDANAKNSANSQQIANINDPNYLTPFEKPQLEIQMDNFATIYKTDKDIAKSEGIDFTAYEAAYQAYVAYMTPLVADMTKYSPIVRSTFNSMVTAVQAEQKRFNTATQAQYNQQIKKAQTDIGNGQAKYQALQSEAETMKSSVAGISNAADRAISSAGFASNAASTASQAASSALASAMSAESNASSAVSTANSTASAFGPVKQSANSALSAASSAVATANSTASDFGKVSQKTDSALTSAVNAQSAASDAVKQASSAAADSKDAKQIAGAVSQSYKTLTDGSTMTIAELQNGLAAKLTKTDLDGYATQTWTQNKIKVTADDISGNLSSVKKTVDGQTTSINDLKADSSGFKSQFTKVNNTLGKQNTDIGTLQATSKSLSANFDSLSSDNKTNQHDIGQLQASAKEVNSTLETVQTQVQDSAVGTNLLKGTDKDISITSHTTDGWPGWVNIDTGFSFEHGKTYTFSAEAKNSTDKIAEASIRVWESSTNTQVGVYAFPADGERHSVTLTIPNDSHNYHLFLYAGHAGIVPGVDVTTTYHHPKLEKGSLATDWCANPADNATVTAVSKISQTVDGMQTDISKKIEQKDLNGYATQDWSNNQIKTTADGINDTLSSVKSTVDGHTTSINTLQTDSNGFKDQFTKVNDTLGKHTTDIGTLQTDSNGFKAQFTTVNDTLGKHTTDIGTLQTDSSGFKTQFQAVNDNIGKNTTDIGTLQASSKELTTGFNTLTADNGTNKNDISQLKQTSKEVNSTLETVQTQVQDSAVGTNLLKGTSSDLQTAPDASSNTGGGVLHSFSSDELSILADNKVTARAFIHNTTTHTVNLVLWTDGGAYGVGTGVPAGTDGYSTITAYNATSSSTHGNISIRAYTENVEISGVQYKELKLEKGSLATDWCPNPADTATVTALTKVKRTADSVQVLANNNQGDIAKLQVTAKGLQSTISDKVSSSQLTQLSGQLTNEIKDLSSSTSSKFTQTSKDINAMVKKGDVVNQFNIDAGGALLSTTGDSTKIVFSSPNIIFDSKNPVQIPNANIPGTLTGKTFEAGTITATTKIKGTDIEAPLIHSPSGSFKLYGNTGDIIGASIHSADNSWGISKDGVINGSTINSSTINSTMFNAGSRIDNSNNTSNWYPLTINPDGDLTSTHIENGAGLQTYISGGTVNTRYNRFATNGYGQYTSNFISMGGDGSIAVTSNGTTNKDTAFNAPIASTYGAVYITPGGISLHGDNESLRFRGTSKIGTNGIRMDNYGNVHGGGTSKWWRVYDSSGSHVASFGTAPGNNIAFLKPLFVDEIGGYSSNNGHALLIHGDDAGKSGSTGQMAFKKDSRSALVTSASIYNRTYSSGSNVYITSHGTLGRSTSASKYKYNIKHAIDEDSLADKLLTMHVSTWNDKHAVDSYAQTLTDNTESEDISIKDNYGLIAEDLRDAGLDMFVEYGKNHTIEGIEYDRAWLPLLPKMRQMNDKINEYELRISKLEAKINE